MSAAAPSESESATTCVTARRKHEAMGRLGAGPEAAA